MNVRRIKLLASEIVGLCEGYEPAEFQAALTLATGIYFKSMFPNELEAIYKQHTENLRAVCEDLDANSHPDDVLELHGIRLDG